jgi:hypothetical protein
MKPVMPKMSPKLILSAAASTLAMAALALSAPQLQNDDGYGAGMLPANVGLPAPSILAR